MQATTLIDVKCIRCAARRTIIVPIAGYKLWSSGQAHIQDALPTLTEDERELLKTGICPVCWDKLFA